MQSNAETATDSANTSALSDLQSKITEYQNQINSLQGTADTLSSQIVDMDKNIAVTQARITQTQTQLNNLVLDIDTANQKITTLNDSLSSLLKVFLARIVANYESGSVQQIDILLTSNTADDLLQKASYLQLVQEHDKKLLDQTIQAKNDYANEKAIYENKKKQVESLKTQLDDYNKQLDAQKAQKERLLSDTQGSEANYEKLLSQAKAQLAAFSNFTTIQGGASLLSGQTSCDDWGCYYNQRDSQWGSIALNSSPYSIASDGCLMTSMAMIYTHYGHKSVTPITINSNPNNFASYFAAYLKFSIIADGASSNRQSVGRSGMDSALVNGNPVIVGISYDNGPLPDHFVVVKSGANGNYVMNDPYTPNGHDISFTSKYAISSIREVDKVNF